MKCLLNKSTFKKFSSIGLISIAILFSSCGGDSNGNGSGNDNGDPTDQSKDASNLQVSSINKFIQVNSQYAWAVLAVYSDDGANLDKLDSAYLSNANGNDQLLVVGNLSDISFAPMNEQRLTAIKDVYGLTPEQESDLRSRMNQYRQILIYKSPLPAGKNTIKLNFKLSNGKSISLEVSQDPTSSVSR